MATLHIFRGLPGSGKSTAARALGIAHYEADMFFVDAEGNYHHQPERLSEAHCWCECKVEDALVAGKDVAVANTNCRVIQALHYLWPAEYHGADAVIHECKGNFGSIHNIPDDAYNRMKESWEELPCFLKPLLAT